MVRLIEKIKHLPELDQQWNSVLQLWSADRNTSGRFQGKNGPAGQRSNN